MAVAESCTRLFEHLRQRLEKSGCRARRMQHMVVTLVPSGATNYVQKWDTSMTHLRSASTRELRVGTDVHEIW